MKLQAKESEIQKAVLEYLQYNGIFAFRVNTMGVPLKGGKWRPGPTKGIPDIIGIIPRKKGYGIPLFVEIKSAKGRTSEAQEQFLGDADHAGALVIVARSVEFVEQILKEKQLL